MVGYIEQEDLRGAQEKCGLDSRGVRGSAALEEQAKQMAQRAESPQRDCGERAGQRPIALGECGKARLSVLDLFVQRALAAQDTFEQIGGDATRGKTRSLRRGSRHEVMSHETPAGVMRGSGPLAPRAAVTAGVSPRTVGRPGRIAAAATARATTQLA
jgi:hypothetical protein